MAFWRDTQVFSGQVRHQGPVLYTPVNPYVIQVNATTGSDANDNPGTSTPLKTLKAALERAVRYTSTTVGPVHGSQPIIHLQAGSYDFGALPVDDYYASFNVAPCTIEGEFTDVVSFTIDHFSDACKVWQPAGNPAWTIDAFVGKVFEFGIDYGPPYGIYYSRYPIIANDTHSLTVVWSPQGVAGMPVWAGGGFDPYTPPIVGDTVKVRDYASIITSVPGSYGTEVTTPPASLSGMWFKELRLDLGNAPLMFSAAGVVFDGCYFTGDRCFYTLAGGNMTLRNCLFANVFALGGIDFLAELFISNIGFLNCSYPINPRGGNIWHYGIWSARNSTCVIYPKSYVNIFDSTPWLYVEGTLGAFIAMSADQAPISYAGQAPFKMLGPNKPDTVFSLPGGPATIMLEPSSTPEASNPAHTFQMPDPPPHVTPVFRSLQDWIDSGHDLVMQCGVRIVGFFLS